MKIIKELRKQADLTLRQVEEATGISNAYLSQLETGKIKSPSTQVMYMLSKLFSYPLEKLLEEAGLLKDKDIIPAVMRTSIENRLENIERRLTELEKKDYRDPITIPFK